MHYWRSVFTHLSFVIAQPAFLIARYLLGQLQFDSKSSIHLTIHALVWICILTKITLPFFNSPLRWLPSPPGEKFLIGHLNFNGGQAPTTVIEEMVNNTPNDGLIMLWGPLYLLSELVVTQPHALMDILNSHSYDWEKPPPIRKALDGILGQGLVNVEGAQHKAMRRVVAPAFSGHNVRHLAHLFYSKAIALTEVMASQVKSTDDGVLDIIGLISRVTLDIIGEAGVGMDFNTLHDEASPLAKLYETVMRPPAFFLLLNVTFPQWLIRRLKGTAYARTLEAQSQLHAEVRRLMHAKKALTRDEVQDRPNKDIIGHIMSSGDFTDDYLVSQMLTFLAAGHDTTAAALTWAILLLSRHPRFQDRLRAECDATLARIPMTEVDASMFEPENMPFLNAVCNETLRLYPPAPGTARHAVVSTVVGGVKIPRGTTATIHPWAINRSRHLWGADAGTFNPDRWLKESGAFMGDMKSPYAFMTFLHGPRSCIGQAFARLELKCLLVAIVARFRFEVAYPNQEVITKGLIVIRPQDGLKLKLFDLKDGDAPMYVRLTNYRN